MRRVEPGIDTTGRRERAGALRSGGDPRWCATALDGRRLVGLERRLPCAVRAGLGRRRSADSSPGEIYPSDVDLPSPGCWHLELKWGSHQADLDIRVDRAGRRA